MTQKHDDSLEGSYIIIKDEEIIQPKPKYSPMELRVLNALLQKPQSQQQIIKQVKSKAYGNISTAISMLVKSGAVEPSKCECCDTTKMYSLSKTFLTKYKQR